MSHPYKSQADSSHKSKVSGYHGSKDQGPGKYLGLSSDPYRGKVQGSTDSMQHKDQAGASGMKRGGRLDKKKSSHRKSPPIALPDPSQAPPSPDMAAMQAGAGMSPSPAPAIPMQKRGGAVKKAGGGAVMPASDRKFPLTAGAETGQGRLQKARKASKA